MTSFCILVAFVTVIDSSLKFNTNSATQIQRDVIDRLARLAILWERLRDERKCLRWNWGCTVQCKTKAYKRNGNYT